MPEAFVAFVLVGTVVGTAVLWYAIRDETKRQPVTERVEAVREAQESSNRYRARRDADGEDGETDPLES